MEAKYYHPKQDNMVQCYACQHRCTIGHNQVGLCGVRLNLDGTLYALTYGQTIAAHVDPIEKKPLYHFMKGSLTYSIATVGCNMHCPWCQNHDISQVKYVGYRLPGNSVSPEEHLKEVLNRQIPSISYTYTEPTIYIEYALELMKLAYDNGIKNIWVTNGYMTEEVLIDIIPYLDAVNVDYKGSDDNIYETYTSGHSATVLDTIRTLYQAGVHVEVTTLVVPTVNDSIEQLRKIAEDIASIGTNIPWHVSRFFPNYKFTNVPKTHITTLQEAYKIGLEVGLQHIHLGNI